MKNKIGYFYLVLFATHYGSLYAAQPHVSIVIEQNDTEITNASLQTPHNRSTTIEESLTNILPDDLRNMILQYAHTDAEEEATQDRFRNHSKTLLKYLAISGAITLGGAAELIMAFLPNQELFDFETSTGWQAVAYSSIACSGAIFIYHYVRLIYVPKTLDGWPRYKRIENNIHGILSSVVLLGSSCASIIQAEEPKRTLWPLTTCGAIGTVCGAVDLAVNCLKRRALHKNYKQDLMRFSTRPND